MRTLRLAAAPGALLLLAAAPGSAQTVASAESSYTPTMADWMAVNDLMYRYRLGVEKGDEEALRSAFWEDGQNIAVPSPGLEIIMPLDGSPPRLPAGGAPGGFSGPPPGAGGPPGGFSGPPPGGGGPPGGFGGPPPGAGGPPGGFSGPPPGAGGPPGGGGGEYIVWHLPFESTFRFESPTRATHYQYFLSIYPEPEVTGGDLAPRERRQSIVGWPGHYEDILEKRNGEWRILSRKSFINQK